MSSDPLTDVELRAIRERCDAATADLTEEYAITHLGFEWWSWIGAPVNRHPEYPKKMRVRQLLSPRQLKMKGWQQKLSDPKYEARPADGTEPLDYTYCSSGCSVEWPPERKVKPSDVVSKDVPRLLAEIDRLKAELTSGVPCHAVRRLSDGKFIEFGRPASSKVYAAGYPMPAETVPGVWIEMETK